MVFGVIAELAAGEEEEGTIREGSVRPVVGDCPDIALEKTMKMTARLSKGWKMRICITRGLGAANLFT